MKNAKINASFIESHHFVNNGLLSEPLYLEQNNNFYYPFVLAFKTRNALNGVFLELLETFIEGLYAQEKERIFEDECDMKFYKMVKFATNIFFLINNLTSPSPNTLLQYKLSK